MISVSGITNIWFSNFQGCKDFLGDWYTEHYVVFLGIGFTVVLIEFMVLLSTILSCTRIYHHNQDATERQNNIEMESEPSTSLKETRRSTVANAYSNETYAVTDSFRKDFNIVERAWWWLKGILSPSYIYQVEVESMLW